jgi:hypothetical protein
MAGPTPLTAPYRLALLYTTGLFQHKTRFYLDAAAAIGGSGWITQPRSPFATEDIQDVVNQVFTKMAPFYHTPDGTFDGWLLELRSGTTWVYQASGTTTATPSGSAAYEKANELAVTGKDTDVKNLPTYFYEGQFGVAFKGNSPGSLGTPVRALANSIYNIDGTASSLDPWAWSFSRNQQFRQRWLAVVIDTNEKLRRLRRIK